MTVRPLASTDSIPELTSLVRIAYQQLADMGFRYWGTWQSEDDTISRCAEGHCLVAEDGGRLVGTVTVKQSFGDDDPDWYGNADVWVISQFAVLPEHQGKGLGSELISAAEMYAFHQSGNECAIDTAEGAAHLIDYYAKRGYRSVGQVDWEGTNYVSVVMSKRLRPLLSTKRLLLRDLAAGDVEVIKSHWKDPRFQAAYPPGRMTDQYCEEVFAKELEILTRYPREGHHWAIVSDGLFIGGVRMSVDRSMTGTLGYGIDPAHWGNGITTEAVDEVVRFGFEELGLHRIQAWVFANNLASQAVLKKLGFRHEGTIREKIAWGDARVDDLIFGLLRNEWSKH